jgi:hypothetical protein
MLEAGTIIIAALTLGAQIGVKSTAEQAIKDTYSALKSLILKKYPSVGVEQLEQKPNSEKRKAVIQEDITDTSCDKDPEVLQAAISLLKLLEGLPKSEIEAIGVDIIDIKAASLTLEDIIATGKGVSIKNSEFQGDVNIKKIRAGIEAENIPKS